jgi:uncharacterized protein (DUF2147 family)
MKRFFLAAIVIFMYTTAAFAADPVEGFWLSVDHKTGEIQSGWEIYQSNDKMFGKMLSAYGLPANVMASKCKESYPNFPIAGKVNQLPVLGTPWIFNLKIESPGRWANGSVIDPTNGSIYKCSLIFHPADGKKFLHETLEIRGQLLVFSGSQYWRKATREEAGALK